MFNAQLPQQSENDQEFNQASKKRVKPAINNQLEEMT